MVTRLGAVGLVDNYACEFPITQSELADATGLSAVHVNRSVQDLRRNGLISLKGTELQIPDWPALKAAGDFDPAYLHFKRKPV
jgi:CRP-like cAMP-binding protein